MVDRGGREPRILRKRVRSSELTFSYEIVLNVRNSPMNLLQGVDEEARAYLQARISLYAMLVLGSIVAEIGLLTATYSLYPHIKPGNADAIAASGSGGLIALA